MITMAAWQRPVLALGLLVARETTPRRLPDKDLRYARERIGRLSTLARSELTVVDHALVEEQARSRRHDKRLRMVVAPSLVISMFGLLVFALAGLVSLSTAKTPAAGQWIRLQPYLEYLGLIACDLGGVFVVLLLVLRLRHAVEAALAELYAI